MYLFILNWKHMFISYKMQFLINISFYKTDYQSQVGLGFEQSGLEDGILFMAGVLELDEL